MISGDLISSTHLPITMFEPEIHGDAALEPNPVTRVQLRGDNNSAVFRFTYSKERTTYWPVPSRLYVCWSFCRSVCIVYLYGLSLPAVKNIGNIGRNHAMKRSTP